MAIDFTCSNPAALLKAFDDRIAQHEPRGKITTWEKRGAYYTHRAPEWAGKAWLKPSVKLGVLTFNIVRSDGTNVETLDYAYYHGHLVQTFLTHFDESFSDARTSAMPEPGDVVRAAA